MAREAGQANAIFTLYSEIKSQWVKMLNVKNKAI